MSSIFDCIEHSTILELIFSKIDFQDLKSLILCKTINRNINKLIELKFDILKKELKLDDYNSSLIKYLCTLITKDDIPISFLPDIDMNEISYKKDAEISYLIGVDIETLSKIRGKKIKINDKLIIININSIIILKKEIITHIEWRPNGSIKFRNIYLNNKISKVNRYISKEDKLSLESIYLLHAEFYEDNYPSCREWRKNGNIKFEIYKEKGSTHSILFYKKGNKKEEYWSSELDGLYYREWYENGSLKEERFNLDRLHDRELYKFYYDNGILSEERWSGVHRISHKARNRFSKEDGPSIVKYDKNGTLVEEQWYLNGQMYRRKEAANITYHPNGVIKKKIWFTHKNSERQFRAIGPDVMEWYDNGILMMECYHDFYGKLHNSRGPAVRKWNKDALLIYQE